MFSVNIMLYDVDQKKSIYVYKMKGNKMKKSDVMIKRNIYKGYIEIKDLTFHSNYGKTIDLTLYCSRFSMLSSIAIHKSN